MKLCIFLEYVVLAYEEICINVNKDEVKKVTYIYSVSGVARGAFNPSPLLDRSDKNKKLSKKEEYYKNSLHACTVMVNLRSGNDHGIKQFVFRDWK